MNDQYIYDKVYALLQELEIPVYPYKQMTDVSYPFLEMANTETDRTATKSGSLQTISLTIDIWGLADERKQVTTIKSTVIDTLINNFRVKETEIEDRLLLDTSTTDVLLHGVLVVPIYLN
ncbi:DUF3168 domain-containing protein [Erwinia sp. CPCC 100877]|nr:DUF3168 domain-containing protein [Erwinia sp. CPCC 100877]